MLSKIFKNNKFLLNKNLFNNSFRYFSSNFENYNKNLKKYNNLNGAQIIYKKLLENNIKFVNGFSGGANLPLLDCFHPDNNCGKEIIKFITNSNEMNSGFVAQGISKTSDDIGVIITTSGPGVTNLVTPLLDALYDGVPIISITGQVATNAPPDPFQGCNALEIIKPVTKWNHKIENVEEIPYIMDYAFWISKSGRPGPVHIDIPKDLQTKIYNNDNSLNYININNKKLKLEKIIKNIENIDKTQILTENDIKDIKKIAELINKSKKPIIYAGQGCNNSYKELNEFVEKTNIPITSTLHALGIYNESKNLALNMIGMHGHPTPNYMIQDADLILAIGSRFDDRTVGNLEKYAPNAKKAHDNGTGGIIHVDIRETENNKVVKPTYFINSDCKIFLNEINKHIIYKDRILWINRMYNLQYQYPIKIPEFKNGKLSVQKVIKTLDNILLNKNIDNFYISTGVGIHQMVTAQLITWKKPKSILSSGSLGTMGVSLGFGIGAKLANPDNIVIAIDGDGSFNMTNTELKTIMDLKIPIKILLLNNNSEMMVEYWQKLFCSERYISTNNDNCDYNLLADAYNIKNLYCDNIYNLEEQMNYFIDCNEPILFHVKIEKTPCLPLVSPGKGIDEMILDDNDYSEIDTTNGPPS